MNFIQNLFEDIINQRVSSSSRLTVHASFAAALFFEICFFFTIPSASIHFVVLMFLTCGAYGAICWVFYQLDTNPELCEALKKAKEEQQKEENKEESSLNKNDELSEETKEKSD
ncbi:hypothetical protein KM1_201590 [Entamoeba histolytica HM-3:IMSS]|uniref:Uncharacterized protein n=4 Tax=Entamoeba histolytica TaxID=5759 RepID=C4M2V7_ENTH1|nr:hypothetical protein EHI_188900 [Entamoeba histolytica HM-1:IMSS]EAL51279.1 hypothetical protein EHI_188900 [Entamoeba histolytica HM-1:IMSS]EMS15863.1 hypothetical protein KM1_201590 [Entamoeba histolytica HM-3:IMSS]ENY65744.1 hypothetical protein EHI7A_128130 [Entamoeba histolytica HM-1:IMSS-A]GAT95628.1 hypothetical protein CL6EHI_188900 [Entamoeba histolytica]|eukprot:XP_656665.1 hypothetical protein EHI_188900 [Entamoeba histolytica HM-1:IMSS]